MTKKASQAWTGYIRLSAMFWDEQETEAIGMAHAAFYIQMACRIRQLRSDGWITEAQVSKLGYPKWRAAVEAMVGIGYLTAHTNAAGMPTYYMPAYLKWNYSEAEFEDLREKKSRAGRKSRCVANHPLGCNCWESEGANT